VVRIPGIEEPNGIAVFTFSRPLTHDETAWRLETATELDDWHPATEELLYRSLDAGTETFGFRLPEPSASHPRRYWRLRIERPSTT
jgi:hypothetical protein